MFKFNVNTPMGRPTIHYVGAQGVNGGFFNFKVAPEKNLLKPVQSI